MVSLGNCTANGVEQPHPWAGIQDLAQKKARASGSKSHPVQYGERCGDTALFPALLLSKKLHLTFPRSRHWVSH